MPTFTDAFRFLTGQAFGATVVPSVDLTGKTIVVTGSNTGLGFECVKHLIQLNVTKVIIACRSLEKGMAAKSQVLESIPSTRDSQLEVWSLDLADYQSILSFASRVSSLSRLDGFLANAGVEMTQFTTTADSLETTIAVNVVSTYLSALAVLPKLEETAAKFQAQTTLTVVGSLIHTFGPDGQLDAPEGEHILESLSVKDTADMDQRYPLSKLMAHMCFHELVERVDARSDRTASGKVVLNLVNPGWCASELGRNKEMNLPQKAIFAMIGRTSEQGSRTLVHGVTAGPESHGRYLSECQVKPESAFMQSEKCKVVSAKLWGELINRFEKVSPEIASVAA